MVSYNQLYLEQEIKKSIAKDFSKIIKANSDEDIRYSIDLRKISNKLYPHLIALVINAASNVLILPITISITNYYNEIKSIQDEEQIIINRDDALDIIEHSIDTYQRVIIDNNNEKEQIVINKEAMLATIRKEFDQLDFCDR